MIKYKHKETGLYLTKVKWGYSWRYSLTENGNVWGKDCLKTLSLLKAQNSFEQFKPEEFQKETYKLVLVDENN